MDLEDDAGGGCVAEELHAVIEKVLRRSTVKVVELLSPAFVLDLFLERNLFGEMTRIIVRDIRGKSTPSERNRTIHEKISLDPTRYPVFKECLAATRQRDLLDVLEKTEDEVHAEMKEQGRCSTCTTRPTDPCTMLASLKCNLDFPVSTMFREAESIIQQAIQHSTYKVTTSMKPDSILDLFEERTVFGDNTGAEDIRALSEQSEKSRAIYDKVSRDWRLYLVFKECLAATRQLDLLSALEKIEDNLHTEMKANGGCCVCQGTDTCQMMASLRCDRDIPQYLSPAVKDTQKQLISLYKSHCQKIPVYPLCPEDREHVENLYVKPSMTEMNPRGQMINQDSHINSEKKVNDIRDIFFSDKKPLRDIYLVAESGSGKSTLCEFLVYLWVKAHSAKDRKGGNIGVESFMNDFTLLFYISLRTANSDSIWDIEDMIRSQLDLNLDEKDMSKLILENRCLVILDGLDEYSLEHKGNTRFISANLPWRRPSDKCTILTTSRPWKLELLANELGDQIDRQIRINGLDSESQKDLAENVINLLNSRNEQDKNVKDFIHDIKKQQLDKYMKTPILLLQIIGFWFDGESFGKSQCEIYCKIVEKQIEFATKVKKIPEAPNTEELHSAETKPKKMGLLHRLLKNVPCKHHAKASSGDESHSGELPACFSGQGYCQTYQGLLLKLSKLAYDLLFRCQNSILVFDHDQMQIMGLSEEEIQTCLHLGLLTQYKVLGKITQRQKSISFVHKSNQEFFAAMFLCQTSDLKLLLERYTDLKGALPFDKVLSFVSGMNADRSREISNRTFGLKSSDDPNIKQYRESCLSSYAPGTLMVKHTQNLVLTAIEECRKRQSAPFLLQDIWIKHGRYSNVPSSRIVACSRSLQLSHVRSIYIENPFDKKRDKIWRLMKNASQLHKLILINCDINVSVLQEVVKENRDSLQVIGLYSVRKFSLLDEKTQNLIVSANSLALCDVDLTQEQVKLLYKHLGQRPHTQVVLNKLRCNHHDDSCKPRLDLSTSHQLHTLKLGWMPVQEVVFVPDTLLNCEIAGLSAIGAASAIRNLREARSLETLKFNNDTSDAVNQELVRTLPRLDTLRYIELANIDMTCTQQHVFPDHMKVLEKIFLEEVRMRATQLRQLLAALPSDVVHVGLKLVTITDIDNNDDIILEDTSNSTLLFC